MGVVRNARRAISVGTALVAGYRWYQRYRSRQGAASAAPGGTPERAAPTRA